MRCILHVYFQNRSLQSLKIQQINIITAISEILQFAVNMSIFHIQTMYLEISYKMCPQYWLNIFSLYIFTCAFCKGKFLQWNSGKTYPTKQRTVISMAVDSNRS